MARVGGGGEIDVFQEGHEAKGEAPALRVRLVRPIEATLGGGPVVSALMNPWMRTQISISRPIANKMLFMSILLTVAHPNGRISGSR